MQEFAIIISSIAGVATAAAIRRTPRNKSQLLSIGASSHIKSQINALKIEKDILTKTIARLYQTDSDLSKIQREKLLIKYQHQLGIILAKLEKLEDASKHPDLGPLGDGLITLMDQKLSNLDNKLFELSSKLDSKNDSTDEIKSKITPKISKPELKQMPKSEPQIEMQSKRNAFVFEKPKPMKSDPVIIPPTPTRSSFELTTLTKISKKEPKFPLFEKPNIKREEIVSDAIKPKKRIQEKIEVTQKDFHKSQLKFETKPDLTKEVEKLTKLKALPEPQKENTKSAETFDDFDDDSDDIDKIKGEILNVLSKLDQAEVE